MAPPRLAPHMPTRLLVIAHATFSCNSYAPLNLPPTTTTMISSGFTNASVSRFLVFSTVIGAVLATITDTRYYLHIAVVPHIWKYGQFWKFLTWQVSCFTLLLEEGYMGLALWSERECAPVKLTRLDMLHKLNRSALRRAHILSTPRNRAFMGKPKIRRTSNPHPYTHTISSI